MIKVEIIPAKNDNYIFIVYNSNDQKAIVIDPTLCEPVIKFMKEKNLKLSYILNTHHHQDHVAANLKLKSITNCNIIGSKNDEERIPGINRTLSHDEILEINNIKFKIIETPGHTLGSICYWIQSENILFCGDTLFSSGCGRLFEGSAKEMLLSLEKIKLLPKETLIYCAHEYTLKNIDFALTIEPQNTHLLKKKRIAKNKRDKNLPTIPCKLSEELLTNPFLRTDLNTIKKKLRLETSHEYEIFQELRNKRDSF